MSSEELSRWLAYDRAFGLPDSKREAARICLTIAQALGGNKRARLENFLPRRPPATSTAQSPRFISGFVRSKIDAVEASKARLQGGG